MMESSDLRFVKIVFLLSFLLGLFFYIQSKQPTKLIPTGEVGLVELTINGRVVDIHLYPQDGQLAILLSQEESEIYCNNAQCVVFKVDEELYYNGIGLKPSHYNEDAYAIDIPFLQRLDMRKLMYYSQGEYLLIDISDELISLTEESLVGVEGKTMTFVARVFKEK